MIIVYDLYIIYIPRNEDPDNADYSDGEVNDDYVFFDTLGTCVVKTGAMFVGELEFSDIPFR